MASNEVGEHISVQLLVRDQIAIPMVGDRVTLPLVHAPGAIEYWNTTGGDVDVSDAQGALVAKLRPGQVGTFVSEAGSRLYDLPPTDRAMWRLEKWRYRDLPGLAQPVASETAPPACKTGECPCGGSWGVCEYHR